MKLKPNQTRTYDCEGFKKRAACLCFKNEREDEVLLVSSSRLPDQWIVPGGGMEPEEEPCGAAVREVFEEAGVKGKLGRLLGVFEQNQDRKHRTYVYVLTVTETLEAWEDSVNIGTVSLSCECMQREMQLMWCVSVLTLLRASLHFTKYWIFLCMQRPMYCIETVSPLGYAVTTGAYKSRPLISAAVVLSYSTSQLSVAWTPVSSFSWLCAQ
uniref:diphosphoinositol-polyphosphate diphosphatase n=1 Tax=Monopterus albus TaxID=43700 RepID=A0A3Q3K0G8_MONAL